MAQLTLRAIADLTEPKLGRKLNIGEASAPPEMEDALKAIDTGTEPTELLARVFAHVGRRLPLAQKVAKRFEGQDKRAGIGSDLLALAAQLFRRNEDLVRDMVHDAASNLTHKAAPDSNSQNGNGKTQDPEPFWESGATPAPSNPSQPAQPSPRRTHPHSP